MKEKKSYQDHETLIIGCGIKKTRDAWNVDILESVEPDEVVDITKPLPYEDNSFYEVVANYVLCQIRDGDDFIAAMNEIHRVLKEDGVFELRVPNAEFPEAFRDPMDCRYFTKETFDHFNIEHYRWRVFKYGFKPWYIMSIKKERKTRLLVKMRPYK